MSQHMAIRPDVLSRQRRALAMLGDAGWLDWMRRIYLDAATLPSVRTIRAGQEAMSYWTLPSVCRAIPVFQIWTRESVALLGALLQGLRSRQVLEVGAGDGRLTRALEQEGSRRGFRVQGQDDGSWARNLEASTLRQPVCSLRIESIPESLQALQPDTVVVSWMPLGQDWTPLFRACPSVRQYLLIGEPWGGCTGALEQWDIPPGWRIQEVEGFQRVGRSRTDEGPWGATSLWVVRRSS